MPALPRKPPLGRAAVLLAAAFFAYACAGDHARQRAQHYYREGQALADAGDTERAMGKFKKSLALAERTGFRAGVAHNLNELAILYSGRAEYDAARQALQQALVIYQELAMRPEAGKALNNLVQLDLRQGRFAAAIEGYRRLIAWDEASGNPLGMAIAYYNLAVVYERYLGDHEKARAAYERAAQLFMQRQAEPPPAAP